MRVNSKQLIWAGVLAGAVIGSTVVIAADHHEADTTSADDASANIGDLYAFHAGGRLTLILTFDGYKLKSETPSYDPDVLYGFHIDTNGDNSPDQEIWARFGQNGAGEWGVSVEGIPGVEGAVIGAVDEVVVDDASGAQVFAGFRDDPFFFDLEGYNDTLMTGQLSFDAARDFVAFKNTGAIVVEFDHAGLGSTSLAVWATTGRRGS
ncbi:DUF4331 family protein [Enhygromyxa salina]|uniref:DUF4331 domain-containing protein n=1 Tax=Enhygromyxa salina TaxID=215803 RepID=A0A2S9Y0R5_9BACT|nr:DUF4331 family protein [Enhygromyxa salina]PRP98570.1 hypothetical protein ENSA7_65130 [Enhygromyxa salina]